MDSGDINYAARSIANALFTRGRAGQITRVDIDCIRCAVAGFLACGTHVATAQQFEDFVDLTLRKVVERV
jgi:hypothetical protein